MGELAQSMSKDGVNKNMDMHRNQKISLLRRIIEHYNIKSVERKYYTSTSLCYFRFNQEFWTQNLISQYERNCCKKKFASQAKYYKEYNSYDVKFYDR